MRRIRRNDNVMVMAGKERGKQGQVREVLADTHRVVVQGVNMIKRHTKARSVQQPSQIIEREAPLHVSNVRLVCPQCNKPARTGFRAQPNGAKVRYCKRCDADID